MRATKFREEPPLEDQSWNFDDVFGSVCKGANARERCEFWQRDLWFKYFDAFWTPVSENFTPRLWPETKEDWPTGSTNTDRTRRLLLRVTVLGLLQSAILEKWRSDLKSDIAREMTTLKKELKISKFQQRIKVLVGRIDPDFFTTLNFAGFDASKDVRDDLVKQFLILLHERQPFDDIKANHKFWNAS
ncbi:hypothetical protein [Allorhodopirellula solitaria]|uniref:Uncharacterized protein n=1 Tax=Allorhodopirellula solitaria TaxID=2527987 RepID=A0A5C5WPC3_9BACT|nr:hypothetical protein [Allorhodopirellula solitaria]TWT52009.1 hypothetical protein CA85_51470 [Allorhodopirellula solitaria]